MNILRWVAVAALLAVSAAAQKNDWLIVPGQRVGPVTAATTRAELDELFGKENVREQNLDISDGPDVATVVYRTDSSAALAITWEKEHAASVYICFGTKSGPCRWRTASGIRIGLPIRELDKLNGKAFQVSGFGEDRGQVVSWRKGALEEDPAACGHLVVRLSPAAEAEGREMSKGESGLLRDVQGDKPYSSSYIPLLELGTIVSGLEMQFTGAGCAK
jgi:hypothetical protein